MIRKAFRMSVPPDQQAESRRRHNPIWPDLADVLDEAELYLETLKSAAQV